jgi:hypothetical protein
MRVQYHLIKPLVLYENDYTVPQAVFLIEQYILARTNKKVNIVVNDKTNVKKFEEAITTAHSYFKLTYKKLWQ